MILDMVLDDSMWQCLDNAEQLVIDKYGSDSDKLIALREYRKNMSLTSIKKYFIIKKSLASL